MISASRAAWLSAEPGNDRRTQSRTGSIVPAATQSTNIQGKPAENQRRQEPRRGGRCASILSYGGICPTRGGLGRSGKSPFLSLLLSLGPQQSDAIPLRS